MFQSPREKSKFQPWFPLAAVILSLFVLFSFFEIILRFFEEPRREIPLHLFDREASYIYSMNPEHPEINSLGLRGPEFPVPKPAGSFRVLLLGDSVTHGLFVPEENTFARHLERLLNERGEGPRFEVLNAGVNGYTLYNVLEYYKEKGTLFKPDLVLSVFCMNDVADPLAHWGSRKFAEVDLPPEASPDPGYQRDVVLPRLKKKPSALETLLSRSAVYRFLKDRAEILKMSDRRYEEIGGRKIPVYIADESPVKISALADPQSREWQWLRRLYGELAASVREDGARLALVVQPLSYQFSPEYPYFPQKTFMDYCASEKLPCFDPFSQLKDRGGRKLYMGRHRYHENDIWHLSEEGHKAMAELLLLFLEENELLPAQSMESHRTENGV